MTTQPWRTPPIYGGAPIDPLTGLPVSGVANPSMGMTPPAPKQPGVMQRMLGGLLGPSQSYGGLLGEDDQKAARQQALMAMGAQLMSAGGPSATPVSFGQALGPALMAGQQAQQQYGNNMLEGMLLKTKLQKAGTATQTNSQKDYEYAKANGFAGSFEDWKRIASAQTQAPAAIQQYEYWKSLPTKEEKDAYLTVQRNMQPYQMVDMAGGRGAFNRATAQYTPMTTVEQEAAGAGHLASAAAGGKVAGETTATAKFDLPRVEDNSKQMLGLLDQLEEHPGRAQATGTSSMVPLEKLAGTEARDFVALLDQIKGKQFLEAFQSLKGGGAITEVEGTKAENAIARIQDRGQSDGAYKQAIEELRQVVRAGTERARKKAGGAAPRSREEVLKQYGL